LNNLTTHIDRLCTHMVEISLKQYDEITDTWWRNQALKNVAFFAVAKAALDPDWNPPDLVANMVESVLELMEAHAGFSSDWFMHQREDFSQYVPRGHYTRSEALERYFKGLMWLGRMNFRVFPDEDWLSPEQDNERGQNETAQAILICEAMNRQSSVLLKEDVFRVWRLIYLPTAFFVGESDDLTPVEYNELALSIYGDDYGLAEIVNMDLLEEFRLEAQELRDPRILSDFMIDYMCMENVTKGMAVLGQRFIPDSYMLWQLVHPNVPGRTMPRGLDIMNVLGSDRAAEIIGTTPGEIYLSQIEMLRDEFSGLTLANWTQNLYWLWLYSLIPVIDGFDADYPSFMNTSAWNDKCLITALGSWTELKHDTVLYAKQSYSSLCIPPVPLYGYVEPVPQVYARLASLCKMMLDGLEGRYLLSVDMRERLGYLHNLLLELRDISIKELTSVDLSYEDLYLLHRFGYYLRAIEQGETTDIDRAALIVDVHTDPNDNSVLEEATGDPIIICVAVPTYNGTVFIAKGATYSY
ncbi:MAG: DUF3160 domain-containing protein, partial [Candidatus Thorarchaeota archaeon]|nr:DUF3160 domain-containing protein [Candidatus Thorarchaeota archaeon]